MAFKKAEKTQIDPTIVLEGPSGSGKTFTALSIAAGMGSKIAAIDTERSSSAYYADRFDFDICELHDWSIHAYLNAAKEAAQAGYNVLIIDSISHAWKALTEEMENAGARYKGNSMTAWTKEGKPKWNRFLDELFSLGMAVIVTSRVKQAYDISKDDNGKTKIEKLGLEVQAEKDFDYEFGICIRLDQDHNALIIKDRTGRFQDHYVKLPGKEFGKELKDWLSSGKAVVKPIKEPTFREKTLSEFKSLFDANGFTESEIAFYRDELKKCGADEKKLSELLEDAKKCAESKKNSPVEESVLF